MNYLQQKRVLLGITGGIAAYKSADLVRRLQNQGCDVQVMMSQAAIEFVTPLTFQALSGRRVYTDLLDPEAEAAMGHIELARWADVVLIAPATANTLAKLVNGEADDLLTTVCVATQVPMAVAPAMNQAMWQHAATQDNISTLRQRGIYILGPGTGSQACGEVGPGRMLEPLEIVKQLQQVFASKLLSGLSVVITAGPTRENIDPVRFLSNHSSGKMGYSLAIAAKEAGANVILISGPVALAPPDGVEFIAVESAIDMLTIAKQACVNADIFISSAAVADYRIDKPAEQKVKKQAENITLQLVKTPDVVSEIAAYFPQLFTVGFAAETEDLIKNASDKLKRKGLNMVIANYVGTKDNIGFNADDNAVEVLSYQNKNITQCSIEKCQKTKLARELVVLIADQYRNVNKAYGKIASTNKKITR